MKSVLSAVVFLSILLFGVNSQVFAGDVAAGEAAYLAKGCIGCHGPGGNSPNPAVFPKTSGLAEAYLKEQMLAYRSGTRSNPLMSPMSVGLSDADIDNLAAYLAAQK
jgi:cytochrome c553